MGSTLSLACGADRPSQHGGWTGEMRELPGGAVLVANPAEPLWDNANAWRVEPVLRIGRIDGDGPDVFGRIAAIAVDAAGRIHVFDSQAHELRVFSPDGGFVRALGRRGGGPGEFQHAIGMRFSPDGALWIVDGQNARYTVIRSEEIETHRRGSGAYRADWMGGFTADGRFYDAVLDDLLLRVDPAGSTTDSMSIATPSFEQPRLGTIRLELPYAPRLRWAFDPRGYVWTASSHEYRLVQMNLAGDTVRIVTTAVDPPPLSAAQQDSVRRVVRRIESEFNLPVTREMIPESAELLRGLVVDDRGHLWVLRAADRFDVFDPDGRFLGEVSLPFPIAGQALIQGDDVYAISRGALETPVVVHARVVKP